MRLVRAHVEPIADSIDYIDAANPDTLQVLGPDDLAPERTLVALAIRTKGARLIDNIVLGEEPAPIMNQGDQSDA